MGSLPNGKSRFTMMPTKTSIKAVFTTSASNDGIYLLEAVTRRLSHTIATRSGLV